MTRPVPDDALDGAADALGGSGDALAGSGDARDGADGREPQVKGSADPDPAARSTGPVCEICGTPMYDRHCKIACPNCGYLRDCSDP